MTVAIHPITALRGGRSVEWLASASGVPPTTIARIEAGLSRRPHAATFDALADALGAKSSDLEAAHVLYRQAQEADQAQSAEAQA